MHSLSSKCKALIMQLFCLKDIFWIVELPSNYFWLTVFPKTFKQQVEHDNGPSIQKAKDIFLELTAEYPNCFKARNRMHNSSFQKIIKLTHLNSRELLSIMRITAKNHKLDISKKKKNCSKQFQVFMLI